MKNIKTYLSLTLLLLAGACAPANQAELDRASFANVPAEEGSALTANKIENLEAILDEAESTSGCEAAKVLSSGRKMIKDKKLVIGSCWDYIDAIYTDAGYPQRKRLTIYKGKKEDTEFADIHLIQSGDWLYFLNHSYHDHEHSAIFVAWTDFAKKEALMISYAGGNQAKPARYHTYDLSSVYNIMRPNPAY